MAYSALVANAQRTLNALGFNAGTVDGAWGPNTKQAVRNFRAATGLDPVPAGPESAAKYLDTLFQDALTIAAARRGVNLTTEVPAPPVKAGPLARQQPAAAAPLTFTSGGFSMPAILDKLKSPWVIGGAAVALVGIAVLRARGMWGTATQGAVGGLSRKGRKGKIWYVVDEESRPPKTLARLKSERAAVQWISRQKNKAKRERGGFGIDAPQGLGALPAVKGGRCPVKVGTHVEFTATPASRMLYNLAPRAGERGRVTSLPVPGRGRTPCMPGPGGGLVYVDWDRLGTFGVSPFDLTKVK